MKNIVIYVHGKGGSAAEAEHYRQLFPDSEVIGFDYHAQTPWEAKEEFPEFFAQQRKHCDRLTLVANSIGAFFSLSSLDGALVDSACLISPVVDMEKLIENMMLWADVTEQELAEKLEIPTDFGETLSWKYLCYVREHPIAWQVPTEILYAGATIWCPVRVWSSSRRSTAPVSPSWRAVSTGSTQRNRWPYWIAG